ncbi:PAS domain-containing protein [Clostridium estertheticum]|uniref:PAS domain-containing protein n=1 Tax=Clostridium estertheticum TaxID=238834 RepID=A0AA47EJI1_9CLOT|nr:CheR family methyltransferase [Clostridium estertheticum]MBU3154277.1 PAS domain-containing protein [Clostridium estertheticum]MBU3197956.1 PAS domain-containing protein [Clostridium estertheticum]WAG60171.1 PAS domain-containing protein [Clostridium estertheticum]WAG65751.1 PAS domain-containing protein [Clostridium estertheticum]
MKENKNTYTKVRTKNYGSDAIKIDTSKTDFSIVGIGASAGGLEAMSDFLRNVPENSGLAYVIVQHMEKDSKDILVELLQVDTSMKVVQAYENISVEPDKVYIIPPNKDMTIKHNVIHISDYIQSRALHLPIDLFFSSLANDKRERSIGVILSGMGSDGTAGIRKIKEKGGGVFIQEPSSAKYDGMPRSAIKTELVDVISTVEIMPLKIIYYIEHKTNMVVEGKEQTDKQKGYFDDIIAMLRSHTGHDFSSYKRNTIQRRIERCMGIHQFDDIATYVSFLKKNPQELEVLFKEFLIGVTNFFREQAEWELLKDKVIPALLAQRSPTDTVRVWISGCSTGEEAYSLAIVFKEVINKLKPFKDFSIQIFATDLDSEAIDKAREGVFSENIIKDISSERLSKYFVKVNRGYQVVKEIRDIVIFAQQNMIKDPPFTKVDIMICRNLLIYLTTEIQKKLIPLFHYSLNSGGFLFLGSAESVGNFTDLFKPLEPKSRIYQRLRPLIQKEPIEFPNSFAPYQPEANQPSEDVQNMQSLADKLILQCYSPAAVLVNGKGDILYITGRTGKYLEPAAGKVNWNIFAMAREGLNYKLNDAFYKAVRGKEVVVSKNAVVLNEGGELRVDITVNPLKEPETLRGMVMIVFTDVVTPIVCEKTSETEQPSATEQTPVSNKREGELERELLQARQMWQATSVEMQISQEEFKSSNEELQSCNEELQSTNEELTTTKEEVQSSNEELKTINFELQDKLDDLSLVTNDMKNLMDSTNIATLFLDNELLVKRFTNQMTVVSRLISSDVGRPVTDIVSDLIYTELTEDVRQVQSTLISVEKQILSRDGSWFNASILPYRTLDGKSDGVVITFVNITKSKMIEAELSKAKLALQKRIEDQDGELLIANNRLMDQEERGHREVAASIDQEQ